ncbi:MAG: adenosylcobinamide-GDP ribazoletransferase [Arenicella sp.]
MNWAQEKDYIIAAIMFYSRLPWPGKTNSSDDIINKSRKYFPLIGWLIGGLAIASVLLLEMLLPMSLVVLLSMVVTVLATGAFHEDGFADMCDAFGGGWTKEQVLAIMKDSRVGAYALVGIFLLLLIKFFALYELAQLSLPLMLVTYLNAHVSSRFIASSVIQTHDYVQDVDKSKARPVIAQRLTSEEMVFSASFMLFAWLLWLPDLRLLLSVAVAYLLKVVLCYYFKHRIGGYTGDCLGAVQQLTEVFIYLAVLALV